LDPALNRVHRVANGIRTETQVAKLVALNSKNTYHRAKQIYLHGDEDLIQAVDVEEISINKGVEIALLSKSTYLNQSPFHLTAGEHHDAENSHRKTGVI
jgi:hypothetical protein